MKNGTIRCCTRSCQRLQPSEQRRVVWQIDGKPYCNNCYLDKMEIHCVQWERVHRLYDNDRYYDDTRRNKKKRFDVEVQQFSQHTI